MMKKSFFALCLAVLPLATFAQEEGAKYGPYERTSFWNNTYVGLEAASDQVINKHTASNETREWLLSGGGNLTLGKWLTPFYGVEFKGGFSNAYICDQRAKIWSWQLDAPVNLTNWIWGYKEDRKWSWQAYLGAGLKLSTDVHNTSHKNNTFLEVGTKAVWAICKHWDLHLGIAADAMEKGVYNLTDHKLRGATKLQLGLTYNIKRGFKPVENCSAAKYHTSCDARISDLEQQLANCNNQKDAALAALEAAKKAATPAAKETQTVAPATSVFFRINSDKVLDTYKYNLQSYAEAINNTDAAYTVYGYADLQTGTRAYNEKLAQKRADAVKKILVEEYGCNADKITAAVGDLDNAPYGDSTYNRAVIVKTN
jgi:outer membrane protein OmpA-like peptidoglycan-associated protein